MQQKLIQIFNQNITYQPSIKRRIFFGLSFLLFFVRLLIYEAIADIFWQSASYVLSLADLIGRHNHFDRL